MASTYSPNLRIELIGNGEQSNTWGTTTNTNLGTLLEQAISGLVSVDVTAGNVTLTSLNGASDQSRQMIIVATGTPGVTRTITAPAVNKVYIVYNNSNATLSFIASGGTGVSLSAGAKKLVYCDGTNFVEAIDSVAITSGSINGTTIGATTASTGAFTTLSASSTVSGTGFSTYLASPPAIGGTTAAAGKFTTLEYTGTLTGSTGVLNIGSGQLYKDASGNVGIGTSSPASKLNVIAGDGASATNQVTISGGRLLGSAVFGSAGSILFSNGYWGAGYGAASICGMDSGASGGYLGLATTTNGSGTTGTPTERMRIDSSGNVGIGTTSPDVRLHVTAPNPTQGILAHLTNSTATATTGAYLQITNAGIADWGIGQPAGATPALSFRYGTNITSAGTEYMRIDSSGNVLVGTTSQLTPGGVAGVGNIVNTANNGSWALALQNNGSTAAQGRCLGIRNATDFNTTSSEFIYCAGNATARFYVQSNGGIYNYSANNSNLSDERVKKDIEPAPSWLNKINAIEVVNFKYKDQTHDDFNLGVIAQQVEAVAPELINIDGFGETPEDGIPLKSIYETDLVYAMLKSIQELKAIIDTQQEQINSLLGK